MKIWDSVYISKDLFMSWKDIKRSLVNFYLIRGLGYCFVDMGGVDLSSDLQG